MATKKTIRPKLSEREITLLKESRNPKGHKVLNNRGWKAVLADDLHANHLIRLVWAGDAKSYRIRITPQGEAALKDAEKLEPEDESAFPLVLISQVRGRGLRPTSPRHWPGPVP